MNRLRFAFIALVATALSCREPVGAPGVAGPVVWWSQGRGSVSSPIVLRDDAEVRVTLVHDAVALREDGGAVRSATLVRLNKIRGDTTILAPLDWERYTLSGDTLRVNVTVPCAMICPREYGRFVGDTLILTSRYAAWAELRYRRVILLPD
ncbi:MAG: hypothetical protein ACT4OZ_08940 [Gemmatimonadota bacterium]